MGRHTGPVDLPVPRPSGPVTDPRLLVARRADPEQDGVDDQIVSIRPRSASRFRDAEVRAEAAAEEAAARRRGRHRALVAASGSLLVLLAAVCAALLIG